MYQVAPDEKRRDAGLIILDTYFNNGVNISAIYSHTPDLTLVRARASEKFLYRINVGTLE